MKHANLLIAACVAVGLIGCNSAPEPTAASTPAETPKPAPGSEAKERPEDQKKTVSTTPGEKVVTKAGNGLEIIDEVVGKGDPVGEGDLVLVLYRGNLKSNGKEFDSNMKPDGNPLPVRVGAGGVIKGWEMGIPGMRIGGKRKLIIPYQLAYGERGKEPDIPAKSDLVFEITLLDFVKKGEDDIYDKTDLKPGTGPEAQPGDKITINYKGMFANGKVFEDSYKTKTPFTFTLGNAEVIEGWEAGLKGMKEGGKRKLRIPPKLAYGAAGAGGGRVPPDMLVTYEIDLVKVEKKK